MKTDENRMGMKFPNAKLNVYASEEDRQKYLKRYYTEEGIKALEVRLKTLAKLYVDVEKYPFKAMIFGFPTLMIHSKEQHKGMIEELKQILGLKEINIEVNT